MQPPRQHDSRLVITRILRPLPRPTARRSAVPACPRFRSASPPPASPPTPSREDAPRPGLRHRACRSLHSLTHHASGPQDSRRDAPGIALRERRSCRPHRRLARPPPGANGVKCCPRHSRRFRAPIVACAAWSFLRDHLTPRPAVAKSTYRFCIRKIRCAPALQNTGNHRAGESPPVPRVPGEVGWASMVRAVIRERPQLVASIRHPHQPQPSPALGRSRPVNR